MLGNNTDNTKRVYLSIGNGKVTRGSGNEKESFSFVEGIIAAIYSKRSTFGSEVVTRWFIELRDGEELYSICLPYSSGVFKSIILSLASDTELSAYSPVRIEPYLGRNGYTKVVVYSNGTKQDWVTKQLPPTETVEVGGKLIKDDSKQMQLINTLVEVIRQRLCDNS